MTVQPPSTQSPLGESEIRFKNRLTDLKIRISYASSGLGLGSYDPPGVSQDQAQTEFSQTEFIVRFEATFCRWLSGSPDMALQREWVNGVLEGLLAEFDEESIWRRTRSRSSEPWPW
jgi:hypothetical protein